MRGAANGSALASAIQSAVRSLTATNPYLQAAYDGFEATVGVTAVPQLLMYDKSGALVGNHKGLVNQNDLAEAIKTLLKEQAK